jgi:hypothetical protein
MVGEASEAGCFESGLAGFADGWSSSFVLVEWGDVADAGVQANAVVVRADDGQVGAEDARVGDGAEVRRLSRGVLK